MEAVIQPYPSPSASTRVQQGLFPFSKSSTYGNVEIGKLQSTTFIVKVWLLSLLLSATPLGLDTVTAMVWEPTDKPLIAVGCVKLCVLMFSTFIPLTVYSTGSPPSTVYEILYDVRLMPLFVTTPPIVRPCPAAIEEPFAGTTDVSAISGTVGVLWNMKSST